MPRGSRRSCVTCGSGRGRGGRQGRGRGGAGAAGGGDGARPPAWHRRVGRPPRFCIPARPGGPRGRAGAPRPRHWSPRARAGPLAGAGRRAGKSTDGGVCSRPRRAHCAPAARMVACRGEHASVQPHLELPAAGRARTGGRTARAWRAGAGAVAGVHGTAPWLPDLVPGWQGQALGGLACDGLHGDGLEGWLGVENGNWRVLRE
jgi:hypothetical protein